MNENVDWTFNKETNKENTYVASYQPLPHWFPVALFLLSGQSENAEKVK